MHALVFPKEPDLANKGGEGFDFKWVPGMRVEVWTNPNTSGEGHLSEEEENWQPGIILRAVHTALIPCMHVHIHLCTDRIQVYTGPSPQVLIQTYTFTEICTRSHTCLAQSQVEIEQMKKAIVRIDRGDPESEIPIEYLRLPASWEKAVQKLVRHAMRNDTAPNGERYGMKAQDHLLKAVGNAQACMRILHLHQHACCGTACL